MKKRPEEKRFHYVYRVTRNDGKFYVGIHSTDDLDDGYLGSGLKITRSLRKYGKDSHTKEILEFHPGREEVLKREVEIVNEELLNDPRCLNIALGGGRQSEETRKSISSAVKGRTFSDEHRRKLGEAAKGRIHTEEARYKISEANRSRTISEETRKKWSEANSGRTVSEETRKKLSEARKKRVISDETRRKLSEAGKNRIVSEETRKKISESKRSVTI